MNMRMEMRIGSEVMMRIRRKERLKMMEVKESLAHTNPLRG